MKVQPVEIDIDSEGEGRNGGWERVTVEIVAEMVVHDISSLSNEGSLWSC